MSSPPVSALSVSPSTSFSLSDSFSSTSPPSVSVEASFDNFFGFIEGNDINKGIVDVVVTDGFSGNIALKTAEGVAELIFT